MSGNARCMNSVQISLRATAPCKTYELSDTLKSAQMSDVIIVLQQLTHGQSQRVAPITHPESNTFPRTSLQYGLALRFFKHITCPPDVVVTLVTLISFHALSLKPVMTDALSDIFTFPKMYWLHVQF